MTSLAPDGVLPDCVGRQCNRSFFREPAVDGVHPRRPRIVQRPTVPKRTSHSPAASLLDSLSKQPVEHSGSLYVCRRNPITSVLIWFIKNLLGGHAIHPTIRISRELRKSSRLPVLRCDEKTSPKDCGQNQTGSDQEDHRDLRP